MNDNNDVKELVNRLNLLRLQRRELAQEEAEVYEELRTRVFVPTAAIPDQVTSEGFEEGSEGELSVPALIQREEEEETDETEAIAATNHLRNRSRTGVPSRQVADGREPIVHREPRHPHTRIQLGDINSVHLQKGTRVFIINEISHYQELTGESVYHRRGTVTKVTVTGRVYLRTDSGDLVWRKRKNLKAVLRE